MVQRETYWPSDVESSRWVTSGEISSPSAFASKSSVRCDERIGVALNGE
jgi:hypothetical protein